MKPPDIHIKLDINGTTVIIRTMTAGDKEMEAAFVRNLSVTSRYYRFHSVLKELTPDMLARFTQVNYPDNMALIATLEISGKMQQIAVARYIKYPERDAAEVAIVVADDWQGMGLGTRMMIELRKVAADAGIRELNLNVLSENRRMIKLARELGYHIEPMLDDHTTQQLGKPITSNTPNT